MSIVIKIKTNETIDVHEVIGKLFDEGFQPCVKDTNPTLFYFPEISTRLIEFGEDEEGYYTRQVGMACEEDYKAFISTIKIIQQLTNGIVIDEDDEELNPDETFTKEWIKQRMKSDYNSIKVIMLSDEKIKLAIFGPIRKYFFGMNVIKQLKEHSSNEEVQHQYVYELIRKSQYGLPLADYPSIMLISKSDSEPDDDKKSVALISNNKDILLSGDVDFFIIDTQAEEGEDMIFIKREDISKIAPTEWWLFDDRQYFAPKISEEKWNELIVNAQAYRINLNDI